MDCSEEKEHGPVSTNGVLICADCRTSKTPLWRGGPSGPKSLCNACGIKYRKKRRELQGLNLKPNGVAKQKEKSNQSGKRSKTGTTSVLNMLGFGRDLLLKQQSLLWLTRRRRLAEEEQAAVLLMALSSGLL